ncbi:hypothetical protein QZH41_014568, partial [Actinostola sp. cb2023]
QSRSSSSLSSKNKVAATSWNRFSKEEQAAYNKKAKGLNMDLDPEKLSIQEKHQIVEKHMKQIVKEVKFLEELGVEFSGIFLMPSGEVCHLGSTAGQQFLDINSDVDLKFREHFACPKIIYKYTEKDVTKLFQKKYSELVGHPCGEVPWKRENFYAKGMPEGTSLKKPCFYGAKQIQGIMKQSETIQFVFKELANQAGPSGSSTPVETNEAGPSGTSMLDETNQSPAPSELDEANYNNITSTEAKMVLRKVVGEEAATRAIHGGDLLQESEVEVMNLSLVSHEIHLLLHLCEHLFTDDALTSVSSNLLHSTEVCGLILPTYTTADDTFWLFYAVGHTPSDIVALKNQKSRSRIWGHWFDLNPSSGNYTLQEARAYLSAKNIIHSRVGGVVYHQYQISHGQVYRPPPSMKKAIFSILARQGFVEGI